MIVILHVIIAVLSIICATFGYVRPTNLNVRISYALAGLTLASGFYLVVIEPARMLHTCMSGLAYLAVVSAILFVTRRKMAALENERA